MRFRVYFADGHVETLDADNGTAAKAAARKAHGVRKEETKITRVEPIDSGAGAGAGSTEGGR